MSSAGTLTLLFEDVAKKWESSERKRLEERESKRCKADKEKEEDELKGAKLRKEIWIRPEGGRRYKSVSPPTPGSDVINTCDGFIVGPMYKFFN
jgi:hypothetical protein